MPNTQVKITADMEALKKAICETKTEAGLNKKELMEACGWEGPSGGVRYNMALPGWLHYYEIINLGAGPQGLKTLREKFGAPVFVKDNEPPKADPPPPPMPDLSHLSDDQLLMHWIKVLPPENLNRIVLLKMTGFDDARFNRNIDGIWPNHPEITARGNRGFIALHEKFNTPPPIVTPTSVSQPAPAAIPPISGKITTVTGPNPPPPPPSPVKVAPSGPPRSDKQIIQDLVAQTPEDQLTEKRIREASGLALGRFNMARADLFMEHDVIASGDMGFRLLRMKVLTAKETSVASHPPTKPSEPVAPTPAVTSNIAPVSAPSEPPGDTTPKPKTIENLPGPSPLTLPQESPPPPEARPEVVVAVSSSEPPLLSMNLRVRLTDVLDILPGHERLFEALNGRVVTLNIGKDDSSAITANHAQAPIPLKAALASVTQAQEAHGVLQQLSTEPPPLCSKPVDVKAFFEGDPKFTPFERAEDALIRLALKQSHGCKIEAAKPLGIGRQTLYNKMVVYGIDRPKIPVASPAIPA